MCIFMALRGKPVLIKPFGCVYYTLTPCSNICMCCCWSGVSVLSQGSLGAHHHCESFILIQILYLVGVLLMTFDLQTCGHSQGS